MYSKKKCYNCGEIVENCFAHGACPKAVNDPEVSCCHFKHDLYWAIVRGKCVPCNDPIASNGDTQYSDRSKLYVDDLPVTCTLLLLQDGISNFTILIFMIGFL